MFLVVLYYCDANASVNSSCTQHPPGYCRAFACLVSPGGGAFTNFALPRAWAFANPGAIPKLLTRTWPVNITTQKVLLEKKQISSSVKDRNKLKRVIKVCSQFYA